MPHSDHFLRLHVYILIYPASLEITGNIQVAQGQLNVQCVEELGMASRDKWDVAHEMKTTGRGRVLTCLVHWSGRGLTAVVHLLLADRRIIWPRGKS